MHQLCILINNQKSKHILSKNCEEAPKVVPIFMTLGRKKNSRTITFRSLKFASVKIVQISKFQNLIRDSRYKILK